MRTALLTTYLSDYRLPLFERLAARHDIEVLCYGGGERYAPAWFTDLDRQIASARFPARRLSGIGEALSLGAAYDAVVAPFAGGALLPAAYAGARRHRRPFVFWASIWHQPRSAAHLLALPVTRHILRHADSVLAYGEHARRFVAHTRGHDDDIVIAPQSVEPELFARRVSGAEVAAFREGSDLGDGPLVLYVGRLVTGKGIEVLADAWARVVGGRGARGAGARDAGATAAGAPGAGARGRPTLVVIGEGPLAERLLTLPRVRLVGSVARDRLAPAYAASECLVLPSIPTPRFKEPWGLVCNEAMHQGRPVIATTAVGAAAGGLVLDGRTGLVVAPGDAPALAAAIGRLLADGVLRDRLGTAARAAVAPYTFDAMADAFDRAFALAGIS